MKCDLHRFFVPCFIADPCVSTAAGAPTFLATVLVTHPSPQQGMMGIAVLCARLQNLYDWRPFTSHVLLSLHISAVHFGLSTRSVVFFVLFCFPLQQWLMLPSRTFRILLFSSALNLNYWWSQKQLDPLENLPGKG